MSWSSSHRGTEYRLIMMVVIGLCAAGAAGSVVPGLDTAIGAVLIGAVVVAVGVAVVRRELRIRRRLADLDGTIRLAPRPPDPTPELRVQPGDAAQVAPAPTRLTVVRSRDVPAVPPSTPVLSPAAAAGRPDTFTGGVA